MASSRAWRLVKPWIFRSNSGRAPRSCSWTKSGRQVPTSPGTAKGRKLVGGRFPEARPLRKSWTLVAAAPYVSPAARKAACSHRRWKYMPASRWSEPKSEVFTLATRPELAKPESRLALLMPLTTTPPASEAHWITSPPGHMQKEYAARAGPKLHTTL